MRPLPASRDTHPLPVLDACKWEKLEGDPHTVNLNAYTSEDGSKIMGTWICTPGKWFCHVTSDEFCHFMEGRCTYVHESGEVIEIKPDTAAFFRKDWKGVCTVHETVKKVYMIR